MRLIRMNFALIVLMIFGMGGPTCLAAMYSYTDSFGVIHFTNVPGKPRYEPIWGNQRHAFPASQESLYDVHISDAAHIFGLDPSLIKAVIKAESDFNPLAVSAKGAVGLMQLMPNTARAMHVTNLYDPRENIFGGARYLQHLSKLFAGHLDLILASYNAGPEKIMAAGAIPNIRETKQFVKSVLQFYQLYRKAPPDKL